MSSRRLLCARLLPVFSRFLTVFLTILVTAGRTEAQSQEIFIEGALSERRDLTRSGQSVVIRPADETRFDAQTHFKSDPSIALSNAGAGGGFSLPLFRGQDARATHVFVDNMELHDPFSGLPMVDDIDLRAFGSMTLHKGFAPWDFAVMDPGGVVQFILRSYPSKLDMGGAFGDLQGISGWGRYASQTDSLSAAGYLRRETSKGDVKYYSDNNTVLNSLDDGLRRRSNNDHSSSQILGFVSSDIDDVSGRALIWAQQSANGIPVDRPVGNGSARLKSQTAVGSTSLKYPLGEIFTLGMSAGYFQGSRQFSDPGNDIGFASKRSMTSRSRRLNASLDFSMARVSGILLLEQQRVATDITSNYNGDLYSPSATTNKIYFGSRYKMTSAQSLEVKVGASTSQAAVRSVGGEVQDSSSSKPTVGYSVGWDRYENGVLFYAQAGTSMRAPSLLERVGNGADIEGAGVLSNEQSRAGEVGARVVLDSVDLWASPIQAVLNLAAWGRDNHEVIRIDRIASNRWRAGNAGWQRFRGFEGRGDFGSRWAGVELALSWIRAELVSEHVLVPKVPVWQAAGGGRWLINDVTTLRMLSRFVGRMYDDASNAREVGWTLSHDLTVDFSLPNPQAKIGLAVTNLTNIQSTVVRDTVTGQSDGRVPYAGYNGESLAGRSYLISVSASL
jgi:hypothetical protein